VLRGQENGGRELRLRKQKLLRLRSAGGEFGRATN